MYQVDFSCLPIGKYFAATKLCIRFRFGFINADAIAKGWSGADCRGKEHVIELIWSLNSGKRIIFADGKEVHYSRSKHKGKRFEFSGTIAGNHMIQIVAHANPGQLSTSGFGQFDLLVDGCSYFDMPRIYELGKRESSKESITKKIESVIPTVPSADTSTLGNRSQNMEKSSSGSRPYGSHAEKTSKIDQDANSRYASQPAIVYAEPISEARPALADASGNVHSPTIDIFGLNFVSNDVLTSTGSNGEKARDAFLPIQETPSFALVANQIMNAYTTHPAACMQHAIPAVPALALANESHTHYAGQIPLQQVTSYGYPRQQSTYYQQQHSSTKELYMGSVPDRRPISVAAMSEAPHVSTSKLTMEPLNLHELEARDDPAMSDIDHGLHSLVNLSDITESLQSPESHKNKQKRLQVDQTKSKPLPPNKPQGQAINATLSNSRNSTKETKAETKKEVMRSQQLPAAVVGAGMMVEYGASNPSNNGLIPASHGHGTVPTMQQPHPYYHARGPMQSFQRPLNMSQVY